MKPVRAQRLLLTLLTCLQPALVAAQAPTDIGTITADWRCRFCPLDEQRGLHGHVEGGVGNVSDDSFARGEYNGLDNAGAYAIGDADLRYWGDDAHYWTIALDDLGLDTRRAYVEGGQQGSYRLSFEYDEIPHRVYDTARTPYSGIGSSVLTLPMDWVPGASTDALPQLEGALRPVEIDTQRRRFGVGAALLAGPRWELTSTYTRETHEGLRTVGAAIGANFGTSNAVILPSQVNYTTHQLEVAAGYTTIDYQLRFGYFGSFFENEDRFLTWQNPFVDSVDPLGSGSLSQPPDNEFHQVFLDAGYSFSRRTRAGVRVAVGRMLQDEALLPYTVNPSLQPPSPTGPLFPLPRDSADARVDTYSLGLSLVAIPSDALRLDGNIRHEEYDNQTPRDAYDYVIGDTTIVASANAEPTVPYGYRRDSVELAGSYRLAKRTKLQAGIEYQAYRRTFQEVKDTDERGLWGQVAFRGGDGVDLAVRLARSERDGDAYQPAPQTTPPQNPLLRKFNLADRQRNEVNVSTSLALGAAATAGLDIDYAEDDYSDSEIGLQHSDEIAYTLDVVLAPADDVILHGFYSHVKNTYRLKGASAFAPPDTAAQANWAESNRDDIDTVGLGLTLSNLLGERLDLGAEVTYSFARGRAKVDPGTSFPEVKTRLLNAALDLDYRVREHTTVRLGYAYEEFTLRDWVTDDVDVSAIPQVLGLGQQTPTYADHIVAVSVRQRF